MEVEISDYVAAKIAAEFPEVRGPTGAPSEYDFWSGPLAAATFAFRDFASLRFESDPRVRQIHLVDPIFGAVVFIAVTVDDNTVEIADYAIDPDYWSTVNDHPQE